MPKILIVGSEGFIGGHLVTRFLKAGYDVSGCDLYEVPQKHYRYFKVSRLSAEWDDIFSANEFEFCINAAGSGNVPYSMKHPFTDFESNTLDTIRILDTIRRYNAQCRYLHISSAAVYGNPSSLPIRENDAIKPLSPYGWHKLMSENICREYHVIYDAKVAIVRPFSVYGEGLKKQLLWDICSRLKSSDSIQLFGTGNESRDFIHVKDLANLSLLLVEKARFECEIMNAAVGKESTIKSIAAIFESQYNHSKKIAFTGESRAGDPLNWRADISEISNLGFKPSIALEKGIGDYLNWFKSTTE